MSSKPKVDSKSPIGVFDSGVGGLSVLNQINVKLPHESVIYYGDTAHVPYGGRELSEVKGFALSICNFLASAGVKMIVMACNISSAVAIHQARLEFPHISMIGVIEPGSSAALATGAKSIGVLATEGTVKSDAYTRTIKAVAGGVSVTQVACPLFVPLVESERVNSDEAFEASNEYLAPLVASRAEVIILGCTHYPFLQNTLTRVAGTAFPSAEQPVFVDPAVATAEAIHVQLSSSGQMNDSGERGRRHYVVSGEPRQFEANGSLFLGEPIVGTERIRLVGR